MIEHPILFSSDMVRAILDDCKTQTRRVIKPQPADDLKWMGWIIETGSKSDKSIGCAQWVDEFPLSTKHHTVRCPYGHTGDRLWVRETHVFEWYEDEPRSKDGRPIFYQAGDGTEYDEPRWLYPHYKATDPIPELCYEDGDGYSDGDPQCKWLPSIHMPRWASRITLEIVNIRVGLLQEITDDDAIQEGVDRTNTSIPGYARTRFMDLWNSIYFSRPENKWKVNPWVWVIEFKRVEQTQ